MRKYGHCLECKRLLPLEFLERVEYFDGHIIPGAMHHRLLCHACIEKADEVLDSAIELIDELEEDEETYNGVSVSQLKVGGTD